MNAARLSVGTPPPGITGQPIKFMA